MATQMRILYVEDDPEARGFVGSALEEHGHEVTAAASASEGLEFATRGDHELLILDVGLPDGSGFDLLGEIRDRGVEVPAIFLTAQGQVADRIRGLDLGADDYLAKPFALAELLARVRALSRRGVMRSPDKPWCVGDLVVDEEAHRVERAGRRLDLAPKEFALLAYLVQNAGHVVSRSMIVEKVWGWGFETHDNVIDVHVNRLRKKIDRDYPNKLIHTVKGIGYVLEDRNEDCGSSPE
jgi:two-component system copper resistance phosphate regulon response regulator CusR